MRKTKREWVSEKADVLSQIGLITILKNFNVALSLYRVLEITFYFFEGFLEVTTGRLIVVKAQ